MTMFSEHIDPNIDRVELLPPNASTITIDYVGDIMKMFDITRKFLNI
jgi:hypothetical protein